MKNLKKLSTGKKLLYLSLGSRVFVLLLISFIASMGTFLNYRLGYNSARLVSLSSGPIAGALYSILDGITSLFGKPQAILQTTSGMTWSIHVLGIPFTDPIAALSILIKHNSFEMGFLLGLIIPLGLAAIFGRIFCSYICPASLLFFFTSRIRRFIEPYFLLPRISLSQGFAWGILAGGLFASYMYGHGIWTFILPYFAMGQTLYASLAFGTVSSVVFSLIFFAVLDILLGPQFTCKYVCPTGRLLGFIGRHAIISVRRRASDCPPRCNLCAEVCQMEISPRLDQTVNCTLCGECMIICPSGCLYPGAKESTKIIKDRILKELISLKHTALRENTEEK